MNLDVLVFAAHPDDAELSMGGTIARFTSSGLKVGVVDLTRAELSTRGNIKIRANETVAATKILKLNILRFLTKMNILKKNLLHLKEDLQNTKLLKELLQKETVF